MNAAIRQSVSVVEFSSICILYAFVRMTSLLCTSWFFQQVNVRPYSTQILKLLLPRVLFLMSPLSLLKN